jgi:hypothetical protein
MLHERVFVCPSGVLKLVRSLCLKQGTVIIYRALLKIYTLLLVQTGSIRMEHFLLFLISTQKEQNYLDVINQRSNLSLPKLNQYRSTTPEVSYLFAQVSVYLSMYVTMYMCFSNSMIPNIKDMGCVLNILKTEETKREVESIVEEYVKVKNHGKK